MAARPGSIPDHVPHLVPLHGPGDRRPRVLDREVSTIGRARGCELCLDASDVSTIHCVVFRGRRGYHVRDCNSRTGTRVNGELVRGSRQFVLGDILQIGPFSFEVVLPKRLSSPELAICDPAKVQRLRASRRRLAGHALRLRRQLLERSAGESAARPVELQQELARLAELTRVCERRLHDVNEVDRELEADREQFQNHVQKVEKQLAERLRQTDEEIHERWQEFQRRCHAEEARLATLELPRPAPPSATEGPPAAREQELVEREQQLDQQRQTLQAERQELERMKQQLLNGHAETDAALEQQRAALAQQEAAIRVQRVELARMLKELRALQEELKRPVENQLAALQDENEQLRRVATDLQAKLSAGQTAGAAERALHDAQSENDLLRKLLDERERELAEALEHLTAPPAAEHAAADLAALRTENTELRERLAALEELQAKTAVRPAKSANELERYEAELSQERQQLELERAKLASELEQLRVRNEELDEATRELEMQMSRERAEMARERIRMERMREELKQDMEKLQREMSVRESLAPVQRLRDEMKKPPSGRVDPAAERLRQLRPNDTPRS